MAARSRDERGAVAVFTAGLMVILLAFSAFAVDLGTQRVARRDMQALADVVALDAARLLDGRTAQQIRDGANGLPTLQQAKQASQDRNDDGVLGNPTDLRVTPYLVASANYTTNLQTKLPQEVASGDVPRAVVVIASTRVNFGFANVVGVSSGGASRTSVASRAVPSVCFSVGTSALALNTSNGGLSPVLDQILKVNLKAVGYEGLVNLQNASVPLAGLLAQLNVGSVDQVATTAVSVAQLSAAAATVAAANGDTATAQVLQGLQFGVAGTAIRLSDILALQSGTDVAGLTSTVNVLDIVSAGIIAANGRNAIAANVPGLVDVTVTEPPRIACGGRGATATSAQVNLHLRPTLVANTTLGLLGGNTDLTLQLARGTATISTDLSCAPESVTVDVVTGGVSLLPPIDPNFGQVQLKVTLTSLLDTLGIGGLLAAPIRLLGINEVLLDVLLTASAASSTETRTVVFPAAPALPAVQVVPSSGLGQAVTLKATGVRLNPGQNNSLLGLLTPLVNGALSVVLDGLVAPIVNGVLSPALSAVLNPVLRALGLGVGVAEVKMLGRPVCNGVKLVG